MDGHDDTAGNIRCFVALGGNLGNVAATFDSALRELAALPDVSLRQVSTNIQTPAVGPQAGGGFLNAVAEVFTSLAPRELLDRLQQIEAHHGRTRGVHWGPRTLDLDVILYGNEVIDTPDLQVPHPACWYRRFVLDPLTEIAADVVHPVKQATFSDLRSRLLPRPLTVALTGGMATIRDELAKTLAVEFTAAAIGPHWLPTDASPALLFWLGGDPAEFASLPLLQRLDASEMPAPLPLLRGVLSAALGT